jgi:isoleucyl-tRNA synthetase
MKADLPRKEPETQEFWEKNNIYQKIRDKYKGKPKYILHDGPPYANGDVHIGTALNKVLKDIVVRYKSMRGYDSPYVPGWDCHGMPIEHEVVKRLGRGKSQAEIRKECRRYAAKYVQVQREQFKRLGVFGDWDNPYLTMSPEYEARIIEEFKKLVEKGYIYRGLKPIYWCAVCETALAEAEVEYAPHNSPSVYVKFPVKEGPLSGASVLIWTTTPWTLPANLALAFHPRCQYALVEIKEQGQPASGGQVLLLAENRVKEVLEKCRVAAVPAGKQDYKIVKTLPGEELEGLKCTNPFLERESRGVLADFVSLEEGTGVVHIAPGHGEEDYELGLKYDLGILAPVDSKGNFTKEVPELEGLNVFKANEKILEKMREEGTLLYSEEISHDYPHCWRCKKPLIFRATEQWFLRVDARDLRKNILKEVEKVKWVPSWGKERFSNMVEHRPDWCLSRQRAWGIPIPVFYCRDCGCPVLDPGIIETVKKFIEKKGMDAWFEEERILPADYHCPQCGKSEFRKEKDILDVWFDSAVSQAVVLEPRKELSWPADLYLEATDQHRGWFQVSMIVAMGTKGTSPYRAVLTHGLILDAKGKKMSKSLGNVISPQELIGKYGADILRLWFTSIDYTADNRVSAGVLEPIVDSYRRIRNTVRFLIGNLSDFNPQEDRVDYKKLLEIDRWALNELEKLVQGATRAYEKFEFHRLFHDLNNFCVVKMSSFYLDVLKDRLYTFGSSSPERRAAQTVLFRILETLAKLIAPVLSFSAEEFWQYIPRREELPLPTGMISVHLASWPSPEKDYLDKELEERWARLLKYRDEVLKALEEARAKKMIGNSLEARVEISASGEDYDFLNRFVEDLAMIFIVSQVELGKGPPGEGKEGNLKVEVKRAPGKKCVRCWNWSQAVGKDKKHPQLCPRCLKMVEKYYS